MSNNAEGLKKASSHDRPDFTKRSINHRLRESPTRRSPSSSPDSRRDRRNRNRSRSPRHHGYHHDHRDDRRYRDRRSDYSHARTNDRFDHGLKKSRSDFQQRGQKRTDTYEHEHGGRDKKRRYENLTTGGNDKADGISAMSKDLPQRQSKDENESSLQSQSLNSTTIEKNASEITVHDFARKNNLQSSAADVARASAADGVDSLNSQRLSPPQEPPPPALSTEERRKRREAIRAKYRDDALAPAAVDSLKIDAAADTPSPMASTEANTPAMTSHSFGSSPADSPALGSAPSGPGSPDEFKLEKTVHDEDNTIDPESRNAIDEPIAAEYDPSADMASDRERQMLKLQEKASENGVEIQDEVQGQTQNTSMPGGEPMGQDVAPKRKRDKDDLFDFDGVDDEDEEEAVDIKPEDIKARDLTVAGVDLWDDHRGYLTFQVGELVDKRYKLISELGKGTFSSVFDAIDLNTGGRAAIKVMRTGEAFFKAGQREVKYLKMLKQQDPEDKRHAIRYLDTFTHRSSHYCIAFESLKQDLRTTLKKNGLNAGLHISAVRWYASQIFQALTLFRKCDIVHADLKPDNILVDHSDKKIKVCDMGSAESLPITDIKTYMASRFYRAPEIILGMPVDYAIDMWAVGCTLFELYTGKILFAGESNNQMLRTIMDCRGKIPNKMMKKSEYLADYFEPKTLLFISQERDALTQRIVGRKLPMNKITRPLRDRVMAVAQAEKGSGNRLTPEETKEMDNFIDLLDKTLQLNPEKRITPAEALKHPFIYRPTFAPTKPANKSRPLYKPIGASSRR